MSFGDHVLLWVHLAFAIFAIGPVTAAVMATPRHIRSNDQASLRNQFKMTRVYTAGTLGVVIFGLILALVTHVISKPWVIASTTLYVVGLLLLLLILREQHRAAGALDPQVHKPQHRALTARARIASMAGVTGVIWLVSLVLMVWH
jgi:hypothetical protein